MVTSGLLFSLITAFCPVGVDTPNRDQCVYRYESGEMSAQECSIEQVNLVTLYQRKGITSLRLAECWQEALIPLDQLTRHKTELP